MSPATWSTPLRACNPRPRRAAVLCRRGNAAGHRPAVVYEYAGEHELNGKAEPLPLWRALRVVSGMRRHAQAEGLEAPFVGRDAGAAAAEGAVPRQRRDRRAAWSRCPASPGSASPAWLGVLQVHRRPARSRSGGTAAAASPTARASPTGRWRRWCACARGSPRTRTPASALAKLHDARASTCSTPTSERSSSRALPTCSGWRSGRRADRRSLRRVAPVLRAAGRPGPGRDGLRGHPVGRPGLLDFIEYLLEWSRDQPIFVVTLARPDCWSAGRPGARAAARSPALPRAARRRRDGGAPRRARARTARRAARRGSSRAPRACRCTRSRRSGCCSTAACSPGGDRLPAGRADRELDVPETLHALIAARLDGLSRGAAAGPGCRGPRQDLHARSAGGAVGPGRARARAAARGLVRKEVLRSRPTRGRRSAASTASCRISSARRLRHALQARAQARHLAAAAHLERTFAPSTRSSRSSPRTTSPRYDARP